MDLHTLCDVIALELLRTTSEFGAANDVSPDHARERTRLARFPWNSKQSGESASRRSGRSS